MDKLRMFLKLVITNYIVRGSEAVMPLTMAKAGETVIICRISGKDLDKSMANRIMVQEKRREQARRDEETKGGE